jgi:hypothetical protein
LKSAESLRGSPGILRPLLFFYVTCSGSNTIKSDKIGLEFQPLASSDLFVALGIEISRLKKLALYASELPDGTPIFRPKILIWENICGTFYGRFWYIL